jgi:amidase
MLDRRPFTLSSWYVESREHVDYDIIYASATALAHAIRTRSHSSEEIVAAHLDRIAIINPQLNAVVQLTADTALALARAADTALARGEMIGPLHGVPMTIKDNLDTAGVISTGGTTGRAAYIPARDATVVARLRAAGAILLGKTNTPELTLAFETDNLVYGRTSNPYDLRCTSGGSSGGAPGPSAPSADSAVLQDV